MTEYEQQKLFYEQFNTVIHNHQEWLKTPQGCVEVLTDPWKAQPPAVKISHADYADDTKAADVLRMLRARHTQAKTNGQK